MYVFFLSRKSNWGGRVGLGVAGMTTFFTDSLSEARGMYVIGCGCMSLHVASADVICVKTSVPQDCLADIWQSCPFSSELVPPRLLEQKVKCLIKRKGAFFVVDNSKVIH